jgi:hypothetical protein
LTMLALPVLADDLPQTTSDGLVRVQNPKVMIAYVRPNTDWAKYKTIKIEPLVIPPNARNTAPKGERPEFGETYELSDDDVAKIQKAYQEVTREELTKAGYTVVDSAGPDTLVVKPQVTNITLNAPLDKAGGFDAPGLTMTKGAGSMAMEAELADGGSGTPVAVAADRKYSHEMWGINNNVENMSEARSAFASWARELADGLKERAAAPQ